MRPNNGVLPTRYPYAGTEYDPGTPYLIMALK
jgi:hypothetical protein